MMTFKKMCILPSKIILESRAASETTEFQTTSKYRDLAKDYCGLYPLHPISELVLGKKFQQKGKMLQNLAYYCMYLYNGPLLEFFIEHKPRNWKSAVPTERKRSVSTGGPRDTQIQFKRALKFLHKLRTY